MRAPRDEAKALQGRVLMIVARGAKKIDGRYNATRSGYLFVASVEPRQSSLDYDEVFLDLLDRSRAVDPGARAEVCDKLPALYPKIIERLLILERNVSLHDQPNRS